jgi:hypothetical protein
MAYNYHGNTGWIKQPNRIVKTFDSGLCLIQQDYIRRKDKVEYFTFKEGDALSVADSQPCIDGAFIFPEPDYQDMGNGYIKCTITAYGRVNTTGSVTTRKEPVALTATVSEYKQGISASLQTCQTTGQYSFENEVALYSGLDPGLVDIPILKIVLGANESPSTIIPSNLVNVFVAATGENITNKLFFPQIIGLNKGNSIPESLGGDFEGRKLQTEFRIDRVETTDYGRFKEYTLSWISLGDPAVSLGTFIRKGTWSPFAFNATTITTTSVGSSTLTFTGGANYAVLNQPGCVLQQLQVNKTDVLIKQASTTITSFTTAQAAVIDQVISGLTPNTTYAISVTCANNYYVDSETIQVTTISA